ncbi:hypothetical protein ASPNIDRAFT_35931 [Aspergillus niger ATCC 1015]|uniref:Uncharacterized protein n=1 Tax=Aspergillus niger (strain ATCC 1015 / CBS 113.46 / FGSC A1144 / LSHB Ac4 / NCTC 3858a / NRRL 328 / USDA 3528.7) TaxID=380704 RepID=G3XT22_ASPNA|nr:hypothetical protein ASPNIDRAFT_35931 [Aspergillus niger ATCC 1015]
MCEVTSSGDEVLVADPEIGAGAVFIHSVIKPMETGGVPGDCLATVQIFNQCEPKIGGQVPSSHGWLVIEGPRATLRCCGRGSQWTRRCLNNLKMQHPSPTLSGVQTGLLE